MQSSLLHSQSILPPFVDFVFFFQREKNPHTHWLLPVFGQAASNQLQPPKSKLLPLTMVSSAFASIWTGDHCCWCCNENHENDDGKKKKMVAAIVDWDFFTSFTRIFKCDFYPGTVRARATNISKHERGTGAREYTYFGYIFRTILYTFAERNRGTTAQSFSGKIITLMTTPRSRLRASAGTVRADEVALAYFVRF